MGTVLADDFFDDTNEEFNISKKKIINAKDLIDKHGIDEIKRQGFYEALPYTAEEILKLYNICSDYNVKYRLADVKDISEPSHFEDRQYTLWSKLLGNNSNAMAHYGSVFGNKSSGFRVFFNSIYLHLSDTITDLNWIDTSDITDMSGWFSGIKTNLDTLDLHTWDFSKVKDVSQMFAKSNIQSIEFKSLDMHNINDMTGMFNDCEKLKKVSFIGCNLQSVYSMQSMFSRCRKLVSVKIPKVLSEKINGREMFNSCNSLKYLDLSGFKDNCFINVHEMFMNCYSLSILLLPKINLIDCCSYDRIFYNCESLTILNGGIDPSNTILNKSWAGIYEYANTNIYTERYRLYIKFKTNIISAVINKIALENGTTDLEIIDDSIRLKQFFKNIEQKIICKYPTSMQKIIKRILGNTHDFKYLYDYKDN